MPLDPRNMPTSSEAQSGQNTADLERRVAALERARQTIVTTTAPSAPVETVTFAASGTIVNRSKQQPSPGASIVDSVAARAYFWDGTAWKSAPLT